jgi:hypothetical protein
MFGQLIIFFIARVSIPAGIGFGVHEALKPKLGKYAPGAAAHAAYVAYILSGLILGLIHTGHVNMTTFDIFLFVVAIAGLVWLIAQPGMPPALLIIARQAYALVALLLGLPQVFKYFFFWNLVFTAAALAFSILPILFLAMTLKEEN